MGDGQQQIKLLGSRPKRAIATGSVGFGSPRQINAWAPSPQINDLRVMQWVMRQQQIKLLIAFWVLGINGLWGFIYHFFFGGFQPNSRPKRSRLSS